MKEIEYRDEIVPHDRPRTKIMLMLKVLQQERWELCGIAACPVANIFYFKREVKP